MRPRLLVLPSVLIAIVVGSPRASVAQTFDQWFEQRVAAIAALKSANQLVDQNGKGAERQREAPAGDRSTALVDQSSATDFVSAAVSLATVVDPRLGEAASGVRGGSGQGTQSVTASLYGLLAGLNGKPPTDPDFYRAHVHARRATFTIGTAASDPAKHKTDRPAAVYGVKLLLLNGRDLYTARNQTRLQALQKQLSDVAGAQAALKARVRDLLFAALEPNGIVDGKPDVVRVLAFLQSFGTSVVPRLTPALVRRVDEEIGSIPELPALRERIIETYDSIQKARQLAISATSRVRPDAGWTEHRVALVFDYGLSPRVTWTANGSFDYTDKKTEGHARGGQLAMEFVGDLTNPNGDWSRSPIRLSLGTQVQWAASERSQTDVQGKLTLPLATGIDVPIVYRYTHGPKSAESGGQARVGLSFDLSRITKSR